MTPEELYRLPFDTLLSTTAEIRKIVPSAKFSKNFIDYNRYYIYLSDFQPNEAANDLFIIEEALGMPEEARKLLQSEFKRFKHIPFLGVGESRGKMAYRIYLGFSGTEEKTGNSAISIDWIPSNGKYLIKEYDELDNLPRLKEMKLIRECLASKESPGSLAGTSLLVYELCSEIIRKANGALHVTLVRESGGERSSVTFNYYKCSYTSNADIQNELDALSEVFNLSQEKYLDWRRRTADLSIIDVAAGQGWNEEPFVTIYHGPLMEPPDYVHLGQDTQSLNPSNTSTPITKSLSLKPNDAKAQVNTGNDHHISFSSRPQLSLVYAIGQVGFTYISETRRDEFAQILDGNPYDPILLLQFLDKNPWYATSITWILTVESIPIYGLSLEGAFASVGYEQLRGFLLNQFSGDVDQVSLPGLIIGNVRLPKGHYIPVIQPELRGMFGWSMQNLFETIFGPVCESDTPDIEAGRQLLRNILQRIYYELRNNGVLPHHRAMNYIGTHFFQLKSVIEKLVKENMHLDKITCEKSPICRPKADCWDVKLTFFNPTRRMEKAKLVYKITVDVSDIVPVSIGKLHDWYIY